MTQDDTTGGTAREMLRHALATLAYRGGKAVRGSTDHFADFKTEATIRTPGQVLAHIGDLLDWSLSLADGQHVWHDSAPRPWPEEVARFFDALARLDARLASEAPLVGFTATQLFQGPVADALTHVGQIAMLRRMFGSPVRGENYLKAEIVVGRVGPDQSAPRREFG
jgi:hypothetical protein